MIPDLNVLTLSRIPLQLLLLPSTVRRFDRPNDASERAHIGEGVELHMLHTAPSDPMHDLKQGSAVPFGENSILADTRCELVSVTY